MQAKFLQACGTLPETPTEIRKASYILNDSSPTEDSESSKFHSWLPNTSIQKLNLEMEPDQPPTPSKQCEDWVSSSGSSAYGPNRCSLPLFYLKDFKCCSYDLSSYVEFQRDVT